MFQFSSSDHREKLDSMDASKLYLLLVFVSGACAACTTPRQETGICVPLRNCSTLFAMTQGTVTAETKTFLRQSICERTSQQVIVCCPVPPVENQCTDPKGYEGQCVPLPSCPKIAQMAAIKAQLSEMDRNFLDRSKCSKRLEQLKVCCSNAPFAQESPSKDGENVGGGNTQSLQQRMQKKRIPRSPKCGVSLPNRIFGGTATNYNDHLWTVALIYKNPLGRSSFSCGGSIISEKYILTAAHCVEKVAKKFVLESVLVGDWDLETEIDCDPDDPRNCLPAPIDIGIEEKIVHPQYDKTKVSSPHDIALLRLSEKIKFGVSLQPICLPYEPALWNKNFTGTDFTTTGWGLTEENKVSNVKLQVDLPFVTQERCNDILSANNIVLLDSQMCAGGVPGKDTCAGDSGGSLMSKNLNDPLGYWYMAGITSYGTLNCGSDIIPGIYTKVSSYLDWIVDNMRV